MMATEGPEIIGEWETQIRQEPLVVTAKALETNKINLCDPGLNFNDFKKDYYHIINHWFYGGSKQNSVYSVIKPNKDNMPYFGGHNTFFDRPWLWKILGTTYDGAYYYRRDSMVLADVFRERGLITSETLQLTDLAKCLGIEVDETKTHSPLYDCKLAFWSYQKLSEMLPKN
jgi:hypothetical protein